MQKKKRMYEIRKVIWGGPHALVWVFLETSAPLRIATQLPLCPTSCCFIHAASYLIQYANCFFLQPASYVFLQPTMQFPQPPCYQPHPLTAESTVQPAATGLVCSSHSGLWGALSMCILQQQVIPSRHQDKLTTQRFWMSIRVFSLLEIWIWMNVEINSEVSFIVISLKEWNVMPHRTTVLHIWT